MADKADIGLIGLGAMGAGLAANLRGQGIAVLGYDADADQRAAASVRVAESAGALASGLEKPRVLMLMVPASAVDAAIGAMMPHLEPGDIVIDGGNTHPADSDRRASALKLRDILYIGLGVSGGPDGARNGPALMGGGDAAAWARVSPILTRIAARAPDEAPCCDWFGEGGAGHFVKMVHNGIEYADMQLIAETAWLLRGGGMEWSQVADEFDAWGEGPLGGYLLEAAADILRSPVPGEAAPLIARVDDRAGQSGTGSWTVDFALELGVAAPTLAAAVFARSQSENRSRRRFSLTVPETGPLTVTALHDALVAGRVAALAQGFDVLETGFARSEWVWAPARIARVWQAGCVIRSRLMESAGAAFENLSDGGGLMTESRFAALATGVMPGLRLTAARAAEAGAVIPCLASAQAWLETRTAPWLPTALVQAQRDYFGGHGFARTDREGRFSGGWTKR
jgi:6-phosphogluconate dehydrogenase